MFNYPFLTQKERDNETGLDYFEARYYASAQGRFTSPDSLSGSQLNPQTLNLYAYVKNNPLTSVDPTGQYSMTSEERSSWEQKKDKKILQAQRDAHDYQQLVADGIIQQVFGNSAAETDETQPQQPQNTGATEQKLTPDQGSLVWNTLTLAWEALERPECSQYIGKDASTALRSLWDKGQITYFPGRQFADGEEDNAELFAAIRGGFGVARGPFFSRLHIVVGSKFFDDSDIRRDAAANSITPAQDRAGIFLHEMRHYLHPTKTYAENHDNGSWERDITRYCFK